MWACGDARVELERLTLCCSEIDPSPLALRVSSDPSSRSHPSACTLRMRRGASSDHRVPSLRSAGAFTVAQCCDTAATQTLACRSSLTSNCSPSHAAALRVGHDRRLREGSGCEHDRTLKASDSSFSRALTKSWDDDLRVNAAAMAGSFCSGSPHSVQSAKAQAASADPRDRARASLLAPSC